jgi:hypothetical protein
MGKSIVFSSHAEEKFEILRRHGVALTKEQVEKAILAPDKVGPARNGRRSAQKDLDAEHLIRVIYEEDDDSIRVITFYPARRSRYED